MTLKYRKKGLNVTFGKTYNKMYLPNIMHRIIK